MYGRILVDAAALSKHLLSVPLFLLQYIVTRSLFMRTYIYTKKQINL